MAYINQKSRLSGQITTVTYLFESYLKIASVVFEKLNFSIWDCILAFRKAEIQFLENYTGDFQITFKKESKLHNIVFAAIKKIGHRGYLSAKTAFLVDIGHVDGDVMSSW
jgi:hypothetical protein